MCFNKVYQAVFGNDFTDIFSGYRVFTRRFAKSFPAMSPGFEIETEMSVHASILRLPIIEVPTEYGVRQEGSESKLSTFGDGFLVERMPTWVLAMTMMLGSLMVFMAGVMLDSVARGRAEQKRIHYLSIAPSRGEQHISDSIRLRERRGAVLEDGSVKERGAWSVQVGGNKGRRS